MSESVVTIRSSDSLDEAEEVMRVGKIHHLPVIEDDRLVGMVAHSDILKAQVSVFAELSMSEDREIKRQIAADEVMVREVTTIAPETSALEAAQILATHEYSSLPVVDDGRVVGIVTERDFLTLVIRALKEAEPRAAPSNGATTTAHA